MTRLSSTQFTKDLRGIWSLWELRLWHGVENERRILPMFLSDDGRLFQASARQIWEQMTHPGFKGAVDPSSRVLDGEEWQNLYQFAEQQAEPLYRELKSAHIGRLQEERASMEQAFRIRRDMIERVGLANVRAARLHRLETEYGIRLKKLEETALVHPEFRPILVLEVDAS